MTTTIKRTTDENGRSIFTGTINDFFSTEQLDLITSMLIDKAEVLDKLIDDTKFTEKEKSRMRADSTERKLLVYSIGVINSNRTDKSE